MFFHASRSLEYRTPFGAQPADANVTIYADADKSLKDITLCYAYGLYDFTYHEEPMIVRKDIKAPKGQIRYGTGLMLPHEPCLLFYWFRFTAADEEDSKKRVTKYYVFEPDTQTGTGKVYHEPPKISADEDKYPYAWQITVYAKDFKTPDYMKGSMMYQIFPDRFARDKDYTFERMTSASDREERVYHEDWYEDVDIKGKPSTGYLACDFFGGSLDGIKEKLKYLKSLGIDIIYLNPIFEARSSHRYDTADYLTVDPILGGNEAFDRLQEECKKLGIRLILDGVFSHTGADSKYFNKFDRYEGVGAYKAFKNDKESPYRSWYSFSRDEDDNVTYDSWWGFPDLPNVDENNLSYREFIFGKDGVVDTWFTRGASGLRLDVSDELPDSFIRQMRDTIKEKTNGQGMLVGEVWEDASNKCSYGSYRDFLLGRTHDAVMGYTFRTTVLEFLQGYISAKVFDARMEGFRERYPQESYYCNMNLLSSHDVPRFYTMMAKPADTDNKEEQAKIKVPDTEASKCADLCKMGYALQIGYVGSACLYYGDEVLIEGYKDPFNRRTYPWNKTSIEGMEHLDFCKVISSLRVNNRVLRTGFYRTLFTSENAIAFERFYDENGKDFFGGDYDQHEGAPRVVLIINRGPESLYLSLDDREEFKAEQIDKPSVSLASRYIVSGINDSLMQVGIAPYSLLFVVY